MKTNLAADVQEEILANIGGYPVSKNLLEMTGIFVHTLENWEFTDDS